MATPVWASNWRRSGAATAMRLAPRMPDRPYFDRGNVFQYWRTKLEEACVSCFAPQIPAWNDSDGEALALVFAQEHGAGLEAWQTRSHREDSDSVNPGSNPGPSAKTHFWPIQFLVGGLLLVEIGRPPRRSASRCSIARRNSSKEPGREGPVRTKPNGRAACAFRNKIKRSHISVVNRKNVGRCKERGAGFLACNKLLESRR